MRTHSRFPIAPIVSLSVLAASVGLASAGEIKFEFNPATFTPGQVIDNAYSPFIPGTVSVYFAESKHRCEVNTLKPLVTGIRKSDFSCTVPKHRRLRGRDRARLRRRLRGDYALVEQPGLLRADDFKMSRTCAKHVA